MKDSLLHICVDNEEDYFYINSIRFIEFWSCNVENTFDWGRTAIWKDPLYELLRYDSRV